MGKAAILNKHSRYAVHKQTALNQFNMTDHQALYEKAGAMLLIEVDGANEEHVELQ